MDKVIMHAQVCIEHALTLAIGVLHLLDSELCLQAMETSRQYIGGQATRTELSIIAGHVQGAANDADYASMSARKVNDRVTAQKQAVRAAIFAACRALLAAIGTDDTAACTRHVDRALQEAAYAAARVAILAGGDNQAAYQSERQWQAERHVHHMAEANHAMPRE